jgi:hypothetical protein
MTGREPARIRPAGPVLDLEVRHRPSATVSPTIRVGVGREGQGRNPRPGLRGPADALRL